jgi:uncharacterized C2H2 Zn-finger protein
MLTNLTEKTPTLPLIFECKKCNFTSSNKKDYSRHILTAKHQNLTNLTEKTPKNPLPFQCQKCGKIYKSRVGSWQHSKKCELMTASNLIAIKKDTNHPDTNTFVDILKQNNDFKSLMVDQSKQMQEMQVELYHQQVENNKLQERLIEAVKYSGNHIQNQTINHNNQKFNLNFFLNTTCKDAMNMSEFIENINVDFKDIENIGKDGYVSGMTNMILSRIKDLDITKRPLHCTDLKRETMYIKENDEWSKDTTENIKLRNMITIVAKQNYTVVPFWRKEHPECNETDHPKYNLCMDIMRNIIGDVGMEQARLDSKVIKNLSKSIFIK